MTAAAITAPRTWRPGKLVMRQAYAAVAAILLIALLAVNISIDPTAFNASNVLDTLGVAAPTILAAVAVTPAILVGGGGIDLSVGPLMSLIGAVVVIDVIQDMGASSPWVVIPVALGCGVLSGLLNGFLVAVVRLQPIVATLGTYLAYIGITLALNPEPGGTVPQWLSSMSGVGSLALVGGVLVLWGLFTQTPAYRQLMAVGGDDRAAFAAGTPVTQVRILAYAVTGLLVGFASLSLTALLGSADPNAGTQFTLLAIASVALGGVSLAGGRGGMFGAVLGSLNIFLIQNVLTFYNKSAFTEQLVYGLVLVLAVVGNSFTTKWSTRTA